MVVTRDVVDRFRGFLASCMLEIAPGVYTSPRMTKAVRVRVWRVLSDWYGQLGGGGIVMTWRDPSLPGGQEVRTLGSAPRELHEQDGVYLAWKPSEVKAEGTSSLKSEEK